MAVRAGRLNKRVTLQTSALVDDGGGGKVESWTDTDEMWAAVRPLQGDERFQAQQVQAGLSTEVTIRYRAGVVAQQRFEYGSRVFVIVQPPIDPDETHEKLVCLCEERNV